MLEIIIERDRIRFGPDSVLLSSYYFDIWSDSDGLETLGSVLKQWIPAIEYSLSSYQSVFLPYNLEDEEVEGFICMPEGRSMKLTVSQIWLNGYLVDLDNIEPITRGLYETIKIFPDSFGIYYVTDFIDGLKNLKINRI